jgi:dolichol-phosphate mannosyltransferase
MSVVEKGASKSLVPEEAIVLPITLIVPTYNEESGIEQFIKRWQTVKAHPERMLIMDDSHDRTPEIVTAASQEMPWVECHHSDSRLGLSGSVEAGVRLAQSEWVSVMDGDGQHPHEAWVKGALAATKGDLVVMRRTSRHGRIEGLSWPRTMFSVGCRILAQVALPRSRVVHDPLGGFFFCRRAIWPGDSSPLAWKILLEVLVKAEWRELTEIEYTFAPRSSGVSKASFKIGMGYVGQVWRLWRWQREAERVRS